VHKRLSLSTSARDGRYKDLRKNYFEKLQYKFKINIRNVKILDAATFKQKRSA